MFQIFSLICVRFLNCSADGKRVANDKASKTVVRAALLPLAANEVLALFYRTANKMIRDTLS